MNFQGLLSSSKDPVADRLHHGTKDPKVSRDKTKVVSYRVPHNAAVQVRFSLMVMIT